jgi:hypothetical protein
VLSVDTESRLTCAEAPEASRYNRVAGHLYVERAPLEGLPRFYCTALYRHKLNKRGPSNLLKRYNNIVTCDSRLMLVQCEIGNRFMAWAALTREKDLHQIAKG